MKSIRLKTLKRVSYTLIFGLIGLSIFLMLKNVTIGIDDTTIKSQMQRQLPKTISKVIDVPLTSNDIKTEVIINDVDLKFVNGKIDLDLKGLVSINGKEKQEFLIETFGDVSYKKKTNSFYYKPDKVNVKTNLEALTNDIHPSAKAVKSKVLAFTNTLFNEKKDSVLGEGMIGNFFKEHAIDIANNIFEKTPVYKLKDSDLEGTIKSSLQKIEIGENEILITMSLAKFAWYILIGAIVAALLLAFILNVSVKAKKARSSGADDFVIMFFEIGFEVLLEGASKTLEATGDVVSGVAEGVGDVAGGLADGLS